jgi:hypothetical protein
MNLDAFKLAAKRLNRHFAELSGSSNRPTLPQSLALDTMARVLGYSDFHEARARLEPGPTPRAFASNMPNAGLATLVLGIVGAPGCGKTVHAKNIITKALAEGIPVRILEMYNDKEYRQLAQALNAQIFENAQGEEFFAAWRSSAPFVCANCGSRDSALNLDFAEMALPPNTLFVCDEAHLLPANFKPLGGLCILASQRSEDLPVEPDATFVHGRGKWELQVSENALSSTVTDMFLRALKGPR